MPTLLPTKTISKNLSNLYFAEDTRTELMLLILNSGFTVKDTQGVEWKVDLITHYADRKVITMRAKINRRTRNKKIEIITRVVTK